MRDGSWRNDSSRRSSFGQVLRRDQLARQELLAAARKVQQPGLEPGRGVRSGSIQDLRQDHLAGSGRRETPGSAR